MIKLLSIPLLSLSLALSAVSGWAQTPTVTPDAVAIMLQDPLLPHSDPALTHALAGALRVAGYTVQPETVATMAQADALVPGDCALLVLPRAGALPAALVPFVMQYLVAGGNILALGTPTWATSLVQDNSGHWVAPMAYAEAAALLPPAHSVFDFGPGTELATWRRSSDEMQSPAHQELTTVSVNGRTAGALHVTMANLSGWETFLSPSLTGPFPDGNTTTVFSARGGPHTSTLAAEWEEKDGSRWIATVPVTIQWQRYSLPPAAFHSWANSPERAAAGFHPENVARFSIGLASTHGGMLGVPHEYWLAALGTASASEATADPANVEQIQPLETLAPAYKFFNIHGATRLKVAPDQVIVAPAAPLKLPAAVLTSTSPRPSGEGFAKARGWRWISLLQAEDATTNEWRGSPAMLLLHDPGKDFGGAWAAFAIADPKFYEQPAVLRSITQLTRRMRAGLFLLEGGAEFYTYFPGQPVRLGAQAINLDFWAKPEAQRPGVGHAQTIKFSSVAASSAPQTTVHLRIIAPTGKVVTQRVWRLQSQGRGTQSREFTWKPPASWPHGGYTIRTELIAHGQVIDRLEHSIALVTPPMQTDFVTIKPDGHFYLHGHPWRINGVNYLPSSGVAAEDGEFYENWLSRASYDPEIIERDLAHIEQLGFNAVSVFLYVNSVPSQNLLDFLRRCRNHHLRANLSLRPGLSNYMDKGTTVAVETAWQNERSIIDYYNLKSNDTVFAYEIDWEPSFGDETKRCRIDPEWQQWVNQQYGRVEVAERAWGVPAPRDEQGHLTNPSGAQLSSAAGPATKLVADYRHFLDVWLVMAYGTLRDRLHKLDPNHLVSFRMASAGHPLDNNAGDLPYQLTGLARAVDFLAPESYGRIGTPDRDLSNWFEIAYARAVAPHEPVIWAETGYTVWNAAAQADDATALDIQAKYYAKFYELARQAGADGIFWWWYPGGYRVGEASDYGLINPDGTDRAVTPVVRREGARFLAAPWSKPDVWFDFDRDQHPNGVYGIYQQWKDAFADAIAHSHQPGLHAVTKIMK